MVANHINNCLSLLESLSASSKCLCFLHASRKFTNVVAKLQSQELKNLEIHAMSAKPPECKEVNHLIFITLLKWKQTPKKEMLEQSTKKLKELANQGIKMKPYWTLRRYDAVTIIEAPTEKDAMKALLPFQDVVATETLVAVPREEAIKLL